MAKVIPLRRRRRKPRAVERTAPRRQGEWSSGDLEVLTNIESNLKFLRTLDIRREALSPRPFGLVEAVAIDLSECAHLGCAHSHALTFISIGLDVLRSAYLWDVARRVRVKAVKTKRAAAVIARARACEREARRQMRKTLRAVE